MTQTHLTAMGAAMAAAGADMGRARLYTTAVRDLRVSNGDVSGALATFVEAVSEDAEMLSQLIGEPAIRAAALGYLRSVASDMRGRRGGGGQGPDDARARSATPTAPRNGAAEGHTGTDTRESQAQTAPGDGTGRAGHVALTRSACPSPTDRAGVGHIHGGTQTSPAHPVREPTQSDVAGMREARQTAARSVLDSFKVRDGRSIGDITVAEIEGLLRTDVQHVAVWRMIRKHIGGHAPADAKVRDLIGPDVLQRFIQKGAEVADVG